MAAANRFVLYAETLWISPYVFSSFVALREKGLPFEIVHVNLQEQAQQQPAYRDHDHGEGVPERLHRYAASQWQRPTVQEFVTHTRPAELPERYA